MNLFLYFLYIVVVGVVFYVAALPHPYATVIGVAGVFIGAIHYNIVMIRIHLETK